ncbi:MAG: hypothetical protein WC942_01355 [Clostridia bacterium]
MKHISYAILTAVSFLFACSSTTVNPNSMESLCEPNEIQDCLGPDSCIGAQQCSPNGAYWSDCVCGTATETTTSVSTSTGTSTNVGTGGSAGAINGTGGSYTGGTDVCVPLTCADITVIKEAELNAQLSGVDSLEQFAGTRAVNKSCGTIDNGCGTILDCGGCGDIPTLEDPNYPRLGCGVGEISASNLVFPVANLCQGGCVVSGPMDDDSYLLRCVNVQNPFPPIKYYDYTMPYQNQTGMFTNCTMDEYYDRDDDVYKWTCTK